jgi:hypothetical protein
MPIRSAAFGPIGEHHLNSLGGCPVLAYICRSPPHLAGAAVTYCAASPDPVAEQCATLDSCNGRADAAGAAMTSVNICRRRPCSRTTNVDFDGWELVRKLWRADGRSFQGALSVRGRGLRLPVHG